MLESTASSQNRIATLRKRWEADRGSSAFLPLAEEYRRLGRFRDAIDTLQAGLRNQPSYLSAQVALGRCLLESGDAAGAGLALERVLATDPTQLVANKLLVEAHLRAGNASQASTRLDAYTALNDRDPDVPGLRQRISTALQKESSTGAGSGPGGSRAARTAASTAGLDDPEQLFELPTASGGADLDSLWDGNDDSALEFGAQPGEGQWPPRSGNGDELFAGLGTAAAHRQYLTALFSEGIFARAAGPVVDAVAVFDAEPEAQAEPAPDAPDAPVSEATVTLGELYRRQGHLGEAAEIFHAVLDRDPGNAAAQDGLALTQQTTGASATAAPAPMVAEGVTARKIRALRGYLQGLRRGATPDVP